MGEGRNERSKESLDCKLGWGHWRKLAYSPDCGDGVRVIEALETLREILFYGEGSDDDFLRIVKEDGSKLPRYIECLGKRRLHQL